MSLVCSGPCNGFSLPFERSLPLPAAGSERQDDHALYPLTHFPGNFQWDLADGSGRFYVPDMVVVRPDARTLEEERAAIALVVEVTCPTSPGTVFHDRETKPKEYAKAGVPLYLLVDQERGDWTLFGLAEGWQRYQVAAEGKYGEPIPLPAPFGFAVETSDWPCYRD
ncbi:MAG TPA: Uma2 family endonuclease [Streptosporangiaceae bacterium]|nr:Uma2 family endonuclease [Streptosporangiaceae bacterium]